MTNLNETDLQIIKSALEIYKKNIEEYQHYPSYEFKQSRIEELEKVIAKIKVHI